LRLLATYRSIKDRQGLGSVAVGFPSRSILAADLSYLRIATAIFRGLPYQLQNLLITEECSTARQNIFTSCICPSVVHRVRANDRLPTTTARVCAREIASLVDYGEGPGFSFWDIIEKTVCRS